MKFRVVAGLAVALAVLLSPSSAAASLAQPAVVSANPADWTPRLPVDSTSAVYVFRQVGTSMYVGGAFATLGGAPRSNVAAFDATTGALLGFAPSVNGAVWAVVPTPDGQLVLGGTFTSVNGVARVGLAKVNATTGALDPTFAPTLGGKVSDGQLVGGRLIVSGTFGKRLAALDPVTGSDTGYLNLGVSGTLASNAGPTEVYRFAVDPQGTHLVAIGNFTTVAGQGRARAFMVTLGTTAGSLNAWYYPPLTRMCQAASLPDYMRDVDFSPDGSYFVFASTGFVSQSGDLGLSLCDAAARFETLNASPTRPTWINYTGGDTLHSVVVTGAAVYVGGHERWINNPQGKDNAGPGALSRPGIGAINPTTGLALTWDPRRARGVGAKALYATSAGLWVGSDTSSGGALGCSAPGGPNHDDCAGKGLESHAGIGFLPLP